MNEKEVTMEQAQKLAQVEAPSLVPWEAEELLVQTPEENGAEDKPVTEPTV